MDSKAHHFYGERWLATMRRHNRLTAQGLSLTHYPPVDLLNRPDEVLAEVEVWLRRRCAEVGVDYAAIGRPPGRPQLHLPFVVPVTLDHPPLVINRPETSYNDDSSLLITGGW